MDSHAHFKEEEIEAKSQHWDGAEIGFEAGFLLPAVVTTLSTPVPHLREPLGTVGLGMAC